MTKMLTTLTLLGSLVAVSACSTVDGAISQVSDSERLDTLCRVAPPIHFAFLAIASQTDIDPQYLAYEQQAYATLSVICTNRPADIGEALQTALDAYNIILQANETIAEAKPV